MNNRLDPGYIMQTATGFWASKVLLTAVEFGLFTALGDEPKTAAELGEQLEIHPRGRFDFFDALDVVDQQSVCAAQDCIGSGAAIVQIEARGVICEKDIVALAANERVNTAATLKRVVTPAAYQRV